MRIKQLYSLWAAIFIASCVIVFSLSSNNFNVLTWDSLGYHAYLTQLLVHHDFHIYNLDFYKHIEETYKNTTTLYQFTALPNGEFIIRYTCGWAILNAPFIFIGHSLALLLGYPTDGFSIPYQVAAYSASLTYTLLGIFLLWKVLLNFFSEKQSAWLLIFV